MLKMCAVKDSKTNLFDPPFTCRHEGEAIRDFAKVCTMSETKFGQYPGDYSLYMVATFDDSTGNINPLDNPIHLSNGVDKLTAVATMEQ